MALGVARLVRGASPTGDVDPSPAALRRVFWQGVVVNVLNPKAALFFLALLPQFVEPGDGAVSLQLGVLRRWVTGTVYVALGARAAAS